ncbi:MAG: hypothetical protein DRI94_00735 [Bacteroidetes bacterium]|nr:MAG: hypothetical protein DRI94_00735 [Bacteroidota bacterium]
MKLKLFLIIFLISLSGISRAQNPKWSNNTADVLEQGRKEIGIFSPFKMGLKNNGELAVHPILFFIIPNATYKKQWKSTENYRLASKHTFTYPSFLLKTLSRSGVGGILPATSTIPQLFKLNNTALFSIDKFNQTFTFSAGFDLCLSAGDSDFSYIEWHIVYPRTYSLNNTFTPHAGIDVTGNLYKKFIYEYKFNTFFLTNVDAGIITENQFKITWQKSDKFAVKAGAVYSYGTFPFGKDGGLYPMFDVMFGF